MKTLFLNQTTHPASIRLSRGFSLVELMIALTLGLFIVGGVVAIFSSTQQANRTSEALSRTQENSRLSFELMARSIREAGGTHCASRIPIINALNAGTPALWWLDPSVAIRGYEQGTSLPAPPNGPPNTGAGSRIAGTDALSITSSSIQRSFPITVHIPTVVPSGATLPANTFQVASINTGWEEGVLLTACDYSRGVLFQSRDITVAAPHTNITYDTAAGRTPGNSTANFKFPGTSDYTFYRDPLFIPAMLTPFTAELWYIGQSINATGPVRRSLYRMRLNNVAGNIMLDRDEILEGVSNMQITYLMNSPNGSASQAGLVDLTGVGDYVNADPLWSNTRWEDALAVRITLTLETPSGQSGRADDGATTDIQENLTTQRTITQTITLRERLQ